jgi:hypothetical protein
VALKIEIKTISQKDQRYATVGDWFFEADTWQIRVSKLGDWRMEFLVALHELVEMALCHYNSVSQAAVDTFDQTYESQYGEPGDDPKAPYQKEHSIATGIERLIAVMLGIKWKEYDDVVNQCLKPDSISSRSKATALGSLVD